MEVIHFWFDEIEPKAWWKKDKNFDQLICDRFGELHESAGRGDLASWRETALGRLAEVLVLDQFSRNIYRGKPESFAFDGLARKLASEAIDENAQLSLSSKEKAFLYMPFMHSEQIEHHHLAMKLFSEPGLESNLEFEKRHKAIIDRFGRYPHRNNILERESTEEEKAFLSQPGSSF